MTTTVKDILEQLNNIAPFALAESWDNNGLLIGSSKAEVHSILIGLDPSNALLEEAIDRGCDTIITHHPAIFKPLPAINTDTPGGKFIQTALTNSISVIACHTNFDSAADGVSDALGRALGLTLTNPIIDSDDATDKTGLGRMGTFSTPQNGEHFIQNILQVLELDTVMVAGKAPEQIATVAICGGSGSSLAPKTQQMGADIYLTSEVKHSDARWAEDAGFCIVDGTHYSTEQFAVNLLVQKMEEIASENNWTLNISSTETERHPFVSVGKNSL